jgi:hypothetical protein
MMGVLRGLLSTVLMMAMCWMTMESVEELCNTILMMGSRGTEETLMFRTNTIATGFD